MQYFVKRYLTSLNVITLRKWPILTKENVGSLEMDGRAVFPKTYISQSGFSLYHQLFGNGILSSTLSVRPSNAEGYEFAGEDHFSPSCLESDGGIPLDDGGRLVLSPNGLAGKKEFHR